MVARYSELARSGEAADEARLLARAEGATAAIRRLAAVMVTDLGVVVDRDGVVAEAMQFIDEVEEEDDDLWHAADAIGSLLQARLIGAEDGIELPSAELERAAAAILAPLLAHAACLRWP